MGELAAELARREYEDPTDGDLRSIRLSLIHNHLPRFEEANVIACDWDDNTVEPRPNFDTLLLLLEESNDRKSIQRDGTWTET